MQDRVRVPQQPGGGLHHAGRLQGLAGGNRQGQRHPGVREGERRQDDPARGAGQAVHGHAGQVGRGGQELQGVERQAGRAGRHVDQADRRVSV